MFDAKQLTTALSVSKLPWSCWATNIGCDTSESYLNVTPAFHSHSSCYQSETWHGLSVSRVRQVFVVHNLTRRTSFYSMAPYTITSTCVTTGCIIWSSASSEAEQVINRRGVVSGAAWSLSHSGPNVCIVIVFTPRLFRGDNKSVEQSVCTCVHMHPDTHTHAGTQTHTHTDTKHMHT